jgi:hypothetical protein
MRVTPAAEQQALVRLKANRDLVNVADEFEQLSATTVRATELALLEQQLRLAELPLRR